MVDILSKPEYCSLILFMSILVGNLFLNIFIKNFPHNLTPALNLIVAITTAVFWSPLSSYSLYMRITMGIASGLLPVGIYFIGHNVRDYLTLRKHIKAKEIRRRGK